MIETAVDFGHQTLGRAGHWIQPQKMFGLDGARVAVGEFRLQPFPGARPAVALFLFFGPDHAGGDARGLAQRHGALVAVTDAAVRILLQRRFNGRGVSAADLVPCVVQFDRAALVLNRGFGVAFGVETGPPALSVTKPKPCAFIALVGCQRQRPLR